MTKSAERPSRGFTLVELVVAGTVAAMLLSAITFSLSQLGRARGLARDRAEAFQRAATALEAVRREVAAVVRSEELFDTRVLIASPQSLGMREGLLRSDLLVFSNSMRSMRAIEYQGEGREYETHFRIEDDELGSALWCRRDPVPDRTPDGGGVAEPVADGVVGMLVEASANGAAWPGNLALAHGDPDAAIAWCDCALNVSGTVSLDLAHQRKPMVAVYWTGLVKVAGGAALLTMPHRLLPNIVAGRRIVPEFVPWAGSAGPVARALAPYLDDPAARARTARELDAVARRFEGHDPGREAAEVVLGFLPA